MAIYFPNRLNDPENSKMAIIFWNEKKYPDTIGHFKSRGVGSSVQKINSHFAKKTAIFFVAQQMDIYFRA